MGCSMGTIKDSNNGMIYGKSEGPQFSAMGKERDIILNLWNKAGNEVMYKRDSIY